jgi:3-deoxy-D-manno-octulosonic-acid transferase
MFYIVYNLCLLLLLLPAVIFHLFQLLTGRKPPRLAERFGHIHPGQLCRIDSRPVIWLHAVSVGETVAARPLIRALRERFPGHAILLSNTTLTGRQVAEGFPEKDLNICFPFDFLPAVRRALDSVRPEIIIIMETEIWPNFTREAARRDIPVVMANGRISDRSYHSYLRFSWVFRPALRLFSALCMQTDVYQKRIVAIGASPDKSHNVGNLKYEIPCRELSPDDKLAIRERYRIPAGMTVMTAGSTRPGEEAILIATYRALLAGNSDLLLVLVPRHPQRAGEIAGLLAKESFSFRLRTQLAEGTERFRNGEVLLVDTVGELLDLYALADLAFVGGSLVELGGHNLLEPASVGVPSIFGPHMNNFREIEQLVLQYQAGMQVANQEELTAVCHTLLNDWQQRKQLGENGHRMVRDNGGATHRHMEIISGFISPDQVEEGI